MVTSIFILTNFRGKFLTIHEKKTLFIQTKPRLSFQLQMGLSMRATFYFVLQQNCLIQSLKNLAHTTFGFYPFSFQSNFVFFTFSTPTESPTKRWKNFPESLWRKRKRSDLWLQLRRFRFRTPGVNFIKLFFFVKGIPDISLCCKGFLRINTPLISHIKKNEVQL